MRSARQCPRNRSPRRTLDAERSQASQPLKALHLCDLVLPEVKRAQRGRYREVLDRLRGRGGSR